MVIIDDRPDLHVLIGKRRPGAFVGDMIVFPGGAVDAVDFEVGPQRVLGASAPGLSAADAAGYLHAAVCESREEVGLWPQAEAVIDGARFVAVGHWVTPQGTPRRYDTRFFLARYPGGEAAVCDPELVDVGGAPKQHAQSACGGGTACACTHDLVPYRSVALSKCGRSLLRNTTRP